MCSIPSEEETPDQIGSNGSTPTGIATPQPDPADKRLPSIMHNYFQVGSFSGDKLSLQRLWPCLAKSSEHPDAGTVTDSEDYVVLNRDDGSEKLDTNLPTPPHSLLQSDEMDLSSSPDKTAGSILNTLKKYLTPTHETPSRRQTSLPVSSVSDDPVLASHFSNPSLPIASDACPLTDAPLLDHEKPHSSISCENLAKLTGPAPDVVRLKNTPPLTPRALSNEDKKSVTSVTSAPQDKPDPETQETSTDEIAMKLDEAFPRQASPQNGAPVGPLKGKLTVKISEGRGLRPSVDPYVVCVFEWNEYISKGTKDGEEEEEKEKIRRQIESDVEAGRPMAIPMKSRQSSHNSSLEGFEQKGKAPVTDPHWDHSAVLYVLFTLLVKLGSASDSLIR